MIGLALTVLAATAEPTPVAALSLKGVGLDEKKLAFFSDYLAQEFARDPAFKVISES